MFGIVTIKIIDADLIGRNKHRFPNLCCMKISGYYKDIGSNVELITDYNCIGDYDILYLSKVFSDTYLPDWVLELPNVKAGGTGFDYNKAVSLPEDIEHHFPDYDLYNKWIEEMLSKGKKKADFKYYLDYSIGFLTRHCFRGCSFCVNENYKKVDFNTHLSEFLDSKRKYILLLDDQFLGFNDWEVLLDELAASRKPFQFKQGLDIRLLNDEKAKRLANLNYHEDYIFAFDNIDESELVEEKLTLWRKHCDKRTKLYVFCGYDETEKYTEEFWINDIVNTFKRVFILAKYNCVAYIMRYKEYLNSSFKGIYINLAAWCNQPGILKTKTFRQFSIQRGMSQKVYDKYKNSPEAYLNDGYKKGCCWQYMESFAHNYPKIAESFFDLKYDKEKCYVKDTMLYKQISVYELAV